MTLRVTAAAIAASVLLAAPAAADSVRRAIAKVETRLGADTSLILAVGSSNHDHYRPHGQDYRRGLNQWGQTDREVRDLSRDAVQACRQAVRFEGRRLGFREVEFDDGHRVRQIGPRGFLVTFREVEFESRRREVETRVSCEVRRGSVVDLEGLPRAGRNGYHAPTRRW